MKKAIATVALLIGILIASSSTTRAAILTSGTGVEWIKYSGNPLYMGIEGVEAARVYKPWVIYDGGVFKMWYVGWNETDPNHHGERIYYANSTDAIHWTTYGMVLDVGAPGSWEDKDVGTPVVLKDGTTYKMWYTGVTESGPWSSLGYATSYDGVHWTKYVRNPVMVPGGNGGWDNWDISDISLVFNGTHYLLWYAAQQYRDAPQKVGAATSVDGISWTKYSNNPVLVPGSDWDNLWVWPGPVLRNGSSYVMWYSGVQYLTDVQCNGVATSSDGFLWSKYTRNPVLTPGPSGTWDSARVWVGGVVQMHGGLLMFYAGCNLSVAFGWRIGLATSMLPVQAQVHIDPNILNLKSKSRWITGYIELPEGYDVSNINVSTVVLNGTIPLDPAAPTAIGDYNSNGVPDLMVKFNRTQTINLIASGDVLYGNVTLTVTGKLYDGTAFEGSDVVKVSGLVGDVNCNGKVDLCDVVLGLLSYGSTDGSARWNANANFAAPWNRIDLSDILKIICNLGKKYP